MDLIYNSLAFPIGNGTSRIQSLCLSRKLDENGQSLPNRKQLGEIGEDLFPGSPPQLALLMVRVLVGAPEAEDFYSGAKKNSREYSNSSDGAANASMKHGRAWGRHADVGFGNFNGEEIRYTSLDDNIIKYGCFYLAIAGEEKK
ncbi:hypothetical protein NE237_002846 [Protea cynaroides]|uniref:Uncharacterized protein n=1 Tax=Protea cynaroides TaxID=273540 RepID=A0A9Q0QS10_9MAGN|nr:hypothetical protein NE237_002846 [Protea cynaroides]